MLNTNKQLIITTFNNSDIKNFNIISNKIIITKNELTIIKQDVVDVVVILSDKNYINELFIDV